MKRSASLACLILGAILALPGPATAAPAGTPTAQVDLRMAVGTTPGVCAPTDSTTITIGQEVYYCFQVENTGSSTFNFHDLVDSELGAILSAFPYTLAPGELSPEIIVPATPSTTVTSTATWTAANALGSYQVDDTITFDWQDISGTGTPIVLTDDSVSPAIPAGFAFSFFGQSYSEIYVSSNGFLTVLPGMGSGCCTGAILPSTTLPNGLIAGWWEDLNPSAGGTIHHQTLGSAPNRVLIVQFTDVPHFGGGNLVSKQYKIFEVNSRIEVHYLAAPSDGGTHSAGIENADGTEGLQYYRGTDGLTTPLAVRYEIAGVVQAQDNAQATVTVLIPDIDVDPLSLSSNQSPDSTTQQSLSVANVGDGVLQWSIAEEPVAMAPVREAARTPADPATLRETVSASELKPSTAQPAPAISSPLRGIGNVLWDNGPFVTNPGAGAGGADASVLQTNLGLGTFGFGHQVSAGNRVADDFTVSGAWFVENIRVFAYQTGSTTTSTITEANLRIWDGPPGEPGSSVVFGDTTTNRLIASEWTGAYRVTDTAIADSTRPIMVNTLAVNVLLGPGDYWLDWQAGGSLASGPWAPAVSILGQTVTGNAVQATGGTNVWNAMVDGAFTQGLPFLITGLSDCAAPSDVPWLNVTPSSGSLNGGESTNVAVSFDSTGLAVGTYQARLCVSSNDPDAGTVNGTQLVVVPVELTVELQPRITLAVTVGTQPGVCAASSSLFADAGSTVYYCYTVTNTGDFTLNLHDLVDDQIGTVFTGLSYALTPGASVNTVTAGLSIPVQINASVTNTATWTGYNAGPSDVATAQASASVTLAQPSITLDKTVGTVPGTCAGTSAITVPPGTEVTYCYTVTNTGNVTLNLHDLDDDQLGTLLSGLSYALTPGASAFILQTTTVSDSVVNTAIWDAYNAGPVNVASGQDSATVITSDLIFSDGFEAL